MRNRRVLHSVGSDTDVDSAASTSSDRGSLPPPARPASAQHAGSSSTTQTSDDNDRTLAVRTARSHPRPLPSNYPSTVGADPDADVRMDAAELSYADNGPHSILNTGTAFLSPTAVATAPLSGGMATFGARPSEDQGQQQQSTSLFKPSESTTSTFNRSMVSMNESRQAPKKLTDAEKRAMLENLEFEDPTANFSLSYPCYCLPHLLVNDRAQRLRSNDQWLRESLKLRCELDLSVFPKDVRALTMREFCLTYRGSVNEYMHQEAARRIQRFKLPVTPELIRKRKYGEFQPPPAAGSRRRPAAATLPTSSVAPAKKPGDRVPANTSARPVTTTGRPAGLGKVTAATARHGGTPTRLPVAHTPRTKTPGTTIRPPSTPIFSPKLLKSPNLIRQLHLRAAQAAADATGNTPLRRPPTAKASGVKKISALQATAGKSGAATGAAGRRGAGRQTAKSRAAAAASKARSKAADEDVGDDGPQNGHHLTPGKPAKRRRRGTATERATTKENQAPPASSAAEADNSLPVVTGSAAKASRTTSVRSNASTTSSVTSTVSKGTGGGKRASSGGARAADRAALASYTQTRDKKESKSKAAAKSSGTGRTSRKTSRSAA
ncbi:hypothetical protein IWQ60_010065 [Tieghemiomyces parasiticus]|uniref:Borealin N-terminal domain-containing protein n=1 Tax=Tieghemiomyces parasiticus TaxID=78921 RepID=A0A9W7ZRY1_9FUNG|nr:hypothetical protein IWQ60_010065 [Tieghemiomyces parasiticus]